MLTNSEIPLLAIVVPCYNEELCIKSTAEKLTSLIQNLVSKNIIKEGSYLYLVDDGSSDNTWNIIQKLHEENNIVKGLKFIKNFGNQKALIAGLEGVREIGCDCVVTIDADLQQDENKIEEFVEEYKKGFDIVLGIRKDRNTDTFFKKTTAIMFYKLMNFIGVKIRMNHSDYRLVSKKTLDIMEQFPEKSFFLRGFFNEIGLKTSVVYFDVKARELGVSKFTFSSLLGLALSGITSYSIIPLRIVAIIGIVMSIFAFFMGLDIVFEKIFLQNSPSGFATQVTLLCIFGGIQLFCLGIIGEYIGQLYREVKQRPRYIKDIELK